MAKRALSESPGPLTKVEAKLSPASGSLVKRWPTVVPGAMFSATMLLLSVMPVGA